MVGILLLLQALAAALLYPVLATLEVWQAPGMRGRPIVPLGDLLSPGRLASLSMAQSPLTLSIRGASVEIPPAVLAGEFFVLLSVPLLLVGILFLVSWRPAWVGAILLQALTLALALLVYFRHRPLYVYPIMLYGIVMVLYLNHFEVREVFLPRSAPQVFGGRQGGGL